MTIKQRFWSKVDKKQDINLCWEWKGSFFYNGYGQFSLNHSKPIGAHRYSYEINNGKIYNNLYVRHTCDNKKCVNPNHLILGTHKDNMNDRSIRNRVAHNRGEKAGGVKLTTKDIINIRKLYTETDLTMQNIANKYLISLTQTYNIIRKNRWSHV